jgi:hypothetical protein
MGLSGSRPVRTVSRRTEYPGNNDERHPTPHTRGGRPLPGVLDHVGGQIDSVDVQSWEPTCDRDRYPARAGADVEHPAFTGRPIGCDVSCYLLVQAPKEARLRSAC